MENRSLTQESAGLHQVATKTSRRTPKACLLCREKKKRCDGKVPRCSPCQAKQCDCQYREFQPKRGKGKGKQRMKDLQDQLSKAKSLLSLSLATTRQFPLASAAPSHITSPLFKEQNAVAVEFPDIEAMLGENATVSSKLFGTLGRYWQQVAQRLYTYRQGDPVSLEGPETVLLILTAEDILAELPLFHIPSLLKRLRCQNIAEKCDRPSWLACINALLALVIWSRMANRSFYKMSTFVWAFFKNAYAYFPAIVQKADDMLAVQALLAMTMFMNTSADFRTTSLFLSTACRTIQAIGLGSREDSLSLLEKDERNRVFWVAFILEIEMSMSHGTPSMLTADGFDIDLPYESSLDGCGLIAYSGQHTNVFRLRAELAVVQSRVMEKLYSEKSLKQTGPQLLEIIQELRCELDIWSSKVPLEVRPELGRTLESSLRDTTLVNLHFMYFHSVSVIHWAALRQGSGQEAVDLIRSASQCRAAAMAIIRLLNCLPNPQILVLWHTLSSAVSAGLVLLASVLENSYGPDVQADLELLELLLQWVVKLESEEGYKLVNLQTACSAMVKIAIYATHNSGHIQFTKYKLRSVIFNCTHPIYLTQCLMGNLQNRDLDRSRTLSGILGVLWNDTGTGYGPFVPDILRPNTFGFGL